MELNFQEYKAIYNRMPNKYRKHGDMPVQRDLYDDVDNFIQSSDFHKFYVELMSFGIKLS